MPTSQQPFGLFAFGGNIIDKCEVQLYLFADDFIGQKKNLAEIIPSVLVGISDKFSILYSFPFTPLSMEDGDRSRGLQDIFLQLEYAFYSKSTSTYVDQATVLANISTPTGSQCKNPSTGFGSVSSFLGTTYCRTWVDWLVFCGQGALLTTSNQGSKVGDQYLYQFGFGKNIPNRKGWINALMLEIDGQYSNKNRVNRILDRNSGGNVIYATPSVWISSKDMLLQFGVSFPISQKLYGKQRKVDYVLNFNFAWSFY